MNNNTATIGAPVTHTYRIVTQADCDRRAARLVADAEAYERLGNRQLARLCRSSATRAQEWAGRCVEVTR